MNQVESVVDEIFSLYEKYGNADYIGEPVSQVEHMSQAAELAMAAGLDDEVILAAFFHDIGHLCVSMHPGNTMDGYGIASHEKTGAEYLRKKGFSDRIVQLVENHVAAKRYLTYKYSSYYESLSEASKKTLAFQGGVMTSEEAEVFEKDPLFSLSILLRQWDELAKETGVSIMNMSILRDKARNVLTSNK